MTSENTSPVIVNLADDDRFDRHVVRDRQVFNREQWAERVPRHYRNAVVTDPQVSAWTERLINHSAHVSTDLNRPVDGKPFPRLAGRHRWLLVNGNTGTGKTFQAWGVVRALCESGLSFRWQFVSEVDLLARLRPRHGVDSETEFSRYANTDLLVLDDYGVAKKSEWVEDVVFRLINHRHNEELPTLITTNLPPEQVLKHLDDRIGSRIGGMSDVAALFGGDRRMVRAA